MYECWVCWDITAFFILYIFYFFGPNIFLLNFFFQTSQKNLSTLWNQNPSKYKNVSIKKKKKKCNLVPFRSVPQSIITQGGIDTLRNGTGFTILFFQTSPKQLSTRNLLDPNIFQAKVFLDQTLLDSIFFFQTSQKTLSTLWTQNPFRYKNVSI